MSFSLLSTFPGTHEERPETHTVFMKRTYSLEEIESELLFDMFIAQETISERFERDAERGGWRYTVYSTKQPGELAIHARRGGRTRFRVLKAPFLSEYLGEAQGTPLTGRKALELVTKIEARLGSAFPWV